MKSINERFKKLIEKQQEIADQLSNTQREKDFKVQKLEKHYQSKIERLLQDEQANALIIKITREFINSTSYQNEPVVTKNKKD